jgi:dihydroflavonol-4-reductase
LKIMVTGGTGFVGAHSVRALVEAGHQVRLLVRSPDKIDKVLRPMGLDAPPYVVGDITDPATVALAMDGCDATLHCAAVVALDRRSAARVLELNPLGAQIVLGAAVERGLDPIVHVSSVSALFRPGLSQLTSDLPPTTWGQGYGLSKARAEEIARRLQDEGAPVSITYPASVAGPAAGALLGENADVIATQVKSGLIPSAGSWSVIDVRDLARVHCALMEPGRGPHRYMCGGHLLTMPAMAQVYRELTGRRFPVVPAPAAAFHALGAVMDGIMRVAPIHSLISAEGMAILTGWAPTDDRAVAKDLGIVWRDSRETFSDALRALYDAGRLSAKQVGLIAAGREP